MTSASAQPSTRYLWVTLFAATSTIVGVIWDISWHRSIGRDTFWTPAHLAIYLGGLLAGGASGALALYTTFAGSAPDKGSGVRVWGFTAPLGAWVCIWGAVAMLASAPLDNWWHNAYGLDVKVLSPPHTLLALGMWAIELGALLLVLARQNGAVDQTAQRRYGWMVAFLGGILVQNAGILGIEQVGFANDARNALYYEFAAAAFPIMLVAVGRSAKIAWPTTAAAAAYMAISLIMIWVLPLFPATPMLAPVYNRVTHMIPAPFPLLLVVPAAVMDLLLRRIGTGRDWRLSLVLGAGFVLAFALVQWPAAPFLLSPRARNPFFGVDQWDYSSHVGPWRYEFWRSATDPVTPAAFAIAVVLASLSARLGLWWGNWMARVER